MSIQEITAATDATETADTAHAADTVEAAQARRARFGKLPERIPYSALVEEQPATPKAIDGYDDEHSWLHYSCVALDLGVF